ncbi:hypothetical protein ACFRMN_35135 [Streptomyces sp. NPDC056835]|uniref:hypothetical protein n=1 Tax=Streptomyces sp. NPDC056835 TaxID=3345956 RepID=UPI00369BACF3
MELSVVSQRKPVWAVLGALTAVLLVLQLFTHAAPVGSAHSRHVTAAQAETVTCHGSLILGDVSQHYLTRDRQWSETYAPDGSTADAPAMDAGVLVESPFRAAGVSLPQPRPAVGPTLAALQTYRC